LGRWLDCTDASRQMTLEIPKLAATNPILLQAVVSYAASHLQDRSTAGEAHERCVRMLIVELSSAEIANDTAVLCAIVILRVVEQLNGRLFSMTHHLSGSSALLSKSQGYTIDPTSPGLREAAFWVYVRQCLYNACVFQQPPNIDLHHELSPTPHSWDGSSKLRSETAWANNMTWICVTVVHFCFGKDSHEPSARMLKWQELSIALESWRNTRPDTFDPIWQCAEPTDDCPFPEIRFLLGSPSGVSLRCLLVRPGYSSIFNYPALLRYSNNGQLHNLPTHTSALFVRRARILSPLPLPSGPIASAKGVVELEHSDLKIPAPSVSMAWKEWAVVQNGCCRMLILPVSKYSRSCRTSGSRYLRSGKISWFSRCWNSESTSSGVTSLTNQGMSFT
ncbi:hypothetical protein KCU76_g11, partial [Aureobasidium melanogenum]